MTAGGNIAIFDVDVDDSPFFSDVSVAGSYSSLSMGAGLGT